MTLGARLFASETAQGTAAFQNERPVERKVIWKAKLLLPLCSLLGAIGLFAVVTLWLALPDGLRDMPISKINVPAIVLAVVLLQFSSCTLCSVLLDRAITAWAAGGVLCIGIMGCHAILFHLTGWEPLGTGPYPLIRFGTFLCVESVLLLLLSRAIYVRWRWG